MNAYQFQLGAEVHDGDQSIGHLRKIALEPNNWQVTHLIVERGLLFKRAKAIPASHMHSTTADGIHLSINPDELDRFDDYEETVVAKDIPATDIPPTGYSPISQDIATIGSAELPHLAPYAPRTDIPGMKTAQEKVHLGVSEADIILDEDTVIAGEDEEFGRLNGITTEAETLYLSTVIAGQGQLIERAFQVASSLVNSLSDERIQVSLTRSQVEELLEHTDPWDEDRPHILDRPT